MDKDSELITASRNGDNEALQALSQKYMDFALEKAKGFTSSAIEYDDIVQEAMLGFLSAYCSFDTSGAASFKTYAGVCMNNRIISAINSLERKKCIPREALVALDDISSDFSAGENENPESVFFSRNKTEETVEKIKGILSPRELDVLALFLRGFKYNEIAEKMSVTPKSVDNTIQRIRKKLRSTF